MTGDPTGRSVRLRGDGLDLAADDAGDPSARPVILLHGGGQTRHAWAATARSLARGGWRALCVDLRGHGDSDWAPDGDYRFDRYAKDLRAIMATLPEPPVLVGASLGGNVSLLAIGEEPKADIAALVLVDVVPRLETNGVERIKEFMTSAPEGFASLEEAAAAISAYRPTSRPSRSTDGLVKNLRQRPDGRWVWHWDPKLLQAPQTSDDPATAATRIERLSAAARSVTVPTLAVRGATSDLVTPEGLEHLKGLIPHAVVVEVPRAGHMVAGDQNDRFSEAVIDFLGAVAPAAIPDQVSP